MGEKEKMAERAKEAGAEPGDVVQTLEGQPHDDHYDTWVVQEDGSVEKEHNKA